MLSEKKTREISKRIGNPRADENQEICISPCRRIPQKKNCQKRGNDIQAHKTGNRDLLNGNLSLGEHQHRKQIQCDQHHARNCHTNDEGFRSVCEKLMEKARRQNDESCRRINRHRDPQLFRESHTFEYLPKPNETAHRDGNGKKPCNGENQNGNENTQSHNGRYNTCTHNGSPFFIKHRRSGAFSYKSLGSHSQARRVRSPAKAYR